MRLVEKNSSSIKDIQLNTSSETLCTALSLLRNVSSAVVTYRGNDWQILSNSICSSKIDKLHLHITSSWTEMMSRLSRAISSAGIRSLSIFVKYVSSLFALNSSIDHPQMNTVEELTMYGVDRDLAFEQLVYLFPNVRYLRLRWDCAEVALTFWGVDQIITFVSFFVNRSANCFESPALDTLSISFYRRPDDEKTHSRLRQEFSLQVPDSSSKRVYTARIRNLNDVITCINGIYGPLRVCNYTCSCVNMLGL
jgi:hypothetical protein